MPVVREALGEKTGVSLKCDQKRIFRADQVLELLFDS